MIRTAPKSQLVSAPNDAVISLVEAKNYLRIDHDDEDTFIESLIEVATWRLEHECDTKFINQSWAVTWDAFPGGSMAIEENEQKPLSEVDRRPRTLCMPIGPLVSLTSFSTFDDEDNEHVVPSSDYQADTFSHLGKISLRYGATWPSTVLRPHNGIKAVGVFGLSADAANLPKYVKQAVLEMIGALYEYRGDEYVKTPPSAMLLMEPLKRFKLG